MIALPPTFFDHTRVAWEGAAGRAWAASLPARVADVCARWSLHVDGPVMHGANGIAVPVRRGDEPAVLKVAWVDQELHDQVDALRWWDGRGMVRLLDAAPDEGVLLLERLDASRPLRTLPVAESLRIAGALLRRLTIPVPAAAQPAVSRLTTTTSAAEEFHTTAVDRAARLGDPLPADVLGETTELASYLATVTGDTLVDHDLHDDNVLAGHREPWLAIDPRVMVGAPEYGIAQLLWWRLDDIDGATELRRCFDLLVATADLDRTVARAWTLVRSAGYWIWGLEHGLTLDPPRCATVIEVLRQVR